MKRKIVASVLLAAFVLSGCSLLPGKGGRSSGGFLSGNREHSDKYKSAEEYCEYWYGPCKEVELYYKENADGSGWTVHVMEDTEFGFEYTALEFDKGYFLGAADFAHYYLKEFVDSADLDDITEEYGLEFVTSEPDIMGMPAIKIYTDLELSDDDNRKILDKVIRKLDMFDSERNVFNKKHDNISVSVSVWSAPWERESSNGALYHVETEFFGDNYKDQ